MGIVVSCPGCGVIVSARFPVVMHKANCPLQGVLKFQSEEDEKRWMRRRESAERKRARTLRDRESRRIVRDQQEGLKSQDQKDLEAK